MLVDLNTVYPALGTGHWALGTVGGAAPGKDSPRAWVDEDKGKGRGHVRCLTGASASIF